MHFHRVSSRHWPSPLCSHSPTKMLRGSRKACCCLADIIRDGAPPPGFFWLFAIRELVGVLRRGQGRRDGTRESRCLARSDWRRPILKESSSGYNLQAKRKGTGHCSGLDWYDRRWPRSFFRGPRAAARLASWRPPARPGAGATAAGKTAASNTNHRLQNSPAGLTIHRDLETKETAVRP